MGVRPRHAATAGRIGLFVIALGTAWGAVTTGGGAHGLGVVSVAVPAIAAENPHPAVPPASMRSSAQSRSSRDAVRTASRIPRHVRTPARRHSAR